MVSRYVCVTLDTLVFVESPVPQQQQTELPAKFHDMFHDMFVRHFRHFSSSVRTSEHFGTLHMDSLRNAHDMFHDMFVY
jgi:hypothetical protein